MPLWTVTDSNFSPEALWLNFNISSLTVSLNCYKYFFIEWQTIVSNENPDSLHTVLIIIFRYCHISPYILFTSRLLFFRFMFAFMTQVWFLTLPVVLPFLLLCKHTIWYSYQIIFLFVEVIFPSMYSTLFSFKALLWYFINLKLISFFQPLSLCN